MKKRGFTLIEILVSTAMIALMAAVLLPSLVKARTEGKRAVCLSNLKQLALATTMYLDEHKDYFWHYYVQEENGIRWWFGYEPGGPAWNISHRPLDKTKSVLAKYLRSVDDQLQCPAFPYESGYYFPKFAARSASYGYNIELRPEDRRVRTEQGIENKAPIRRTNLKARTSTVFVFADGIHFDHNPGLNEGHYIQYLDLSINPSRKGGFAHFRHGGRAQILFIDGHATSQLLKGPAYEGEYCHGGPAGNLGEATSGTGIYGY